MSPNNAVEAVRQWNKQSVTFSNAITYSSATPYNSVTCGLGNAQKTWGGQASMVIMLLKLLFQPIKQKMKAGQSKKIQCE